MKIENLLTQYLLLQKKICLQEIGILYLNRDIASVEDATSLPEDAVRFEFDLKAPADEGFIAFVMEKTRKIRPLASSDIESYMMLGKQFLNIGKPFVIKGLGVLLKNQQHAYEFSLGQTSASKIESTDTVIIEKEKSSAEIDFSAPRPQPNHKKKWMPWVLVCIFLLVVGLLYFNFKGSDDKKEDLLTNSSTSTPNETSSLQPTANRADNMPSDSAILTDNKATDSFYVVVRTSTVLSDIQPAYQKLSSYPMGKGLVMYTNDSVTYKIAMPVHLPLSDTAKVRDSLKLKFGKADIEIRK